MTTQPENIAGLTAANVAFPPASSSTAGLPHNSPSNVDLLTRINANVDASLGDGGTVVLPSPSVDSYDADSSLLEGTARAGATVLIYSDGRLLGTATAGEDGAWSITTVLRNGDGVSCSDGRSSATFRAVL